MLLSWFHCLSRTGTVFEYEVEVLGGGARFSPPTSSSRAQQDMKVQAHDRVCTVGGEVSMRRLGAVIRYA